MLRQPSHSIRFIIAMPPRRPQFRSHNTGSAVQRDRWPLAAEHLVSRSLDLAEELPQVEVKSPTRQTAIYRKRIAEVGPQARHGDIVEVLMPRGDVLGYGLFNPRAEAMLRMLTWNDERPELSWWQQRLDRAVELRTRLNIAAQADAYRLIHAEGDGLPGIVADLFGDVLSIETFSLGMFQRAEALAQELVERTGAKHWIIQPAPNTVHTEGYTHPGFTSTKLPQRQAIVEHGLKFEVDFGTGHKTGFFCDQRLNRLQLRDYCAGQTVLDLCCYSGGFALNATAGGAREVIGVDLDEDAIAIAKRNANLNQQKTRFVHADAFAYMRDMQRNGRTFDVVVLDPPKLVLSRDGYEDGRSKYYDFNRLAASLVTPGGLLVSCSCSGLMPTEEFIKTVTAAVPFDRQPRLLARTGAAPDHPVALNCPETEYLKCLWMLL
ncbi:MAG: class I SAM-dependent rRNA methyltransferase [Planctomycetaceae bacterium]|nr:class I SAM-dependent rRNA methyltransferase [Planctomycetaceae bacterium]